MLKEILAGLRSASRATRIEAWNRLRNEARALRRRLTDDDWRQLNELLLEEHDEDVLRLGLVTLLLLAREQPGRAESRPAARERKRSLVEWLWGDFRQPSLVLRVSCPPFQRDESSLFILGRHLSATEYPHVTCQPVPLEHPDSSSIFECKPVAMCILGRLGLYGSEASARWRPRDSTFVFAREDRPADLRRGEIDPEYHCLIERFPKGRVTRYRTVDDPATRQRTDYALVQRHVVEEGCHQMALVHCAGSSALGTLGAVIWATQELSRPMQLTGELIPLPKKVTSTSYLRALLRVTADKKTDQEWSPSRIELVRLYLDDYVWSKDQHEWHVRAPSLIELWQVPGRLPEPLRVALDGKNPHMARGAEVFRLLVALCWQAQRAGYPDAAVGVDVDLADLMAERRIWGGDEATEERLRDRLRQLKNRYLREALTVDERVHLHADVVIHEVSDRNHDKPGEA
jgi:hypothetical protein